MTPSEALAIGLPVALGVQLARDTFRLTRWSPTLFRSGPIVLRDSWSLWRVPKSIPTPRVTTGLFYGAKYKELAPLEVAFTAQTFNAPCLLGRLFVDHEKGCLTLVARPHWSLHAILLVGFTLAGFPWPALLLMVAMVCLNYVAEVWQFHRLFDLVIQEVGRGA